MSLDYILKIRVNFSLIWFTQKKNFLNKGRIIPFPKYLPDL